MIKLHYLPVSGDILQVCPTCVAVTEVGSAFLEQRVRFFDQSPCARVVLWVEDVGAGQVEAAGIVQQVSIQRF